MSDGIRKGSQFQSMSAERPGIQPVAQIGKAAHDSKPYKCRQCQERFRNINARNIHEEGCEE